MAKRKKSAPPTVKTAPGAVDKARSIVEKALAKLDECVDRVSKALDAEEEYDTKLGSHLAYLIEHTTRALDGLRQLERHDRQRAEEMSEAEERALTREFVGEWSTEHLLEMKSFVEERLAADRGVLS